MALTQSSKDQSKENSHTIDNRATRTTQTPVTVPDDADRLPKDLLFGLLSNERRRLALKYLAENGRESDLSALAEHVASIQYNKPEAAITSKERKRVYVGFYQCHLPKLDDADVIEYDQARGTIELRPEANQLLPYLTADRHGLNRTESWYHHLIPIPLLRFMQDR